MHLPSSGQSNYAPSGHCIPGLSGLLIVALLMASLTQLSPLYSARLSDKIQFSKLSFVSNPLGGLPPACLVQSNHAYGEAVQHHAQTQQTASHLGMVLAKKVLTPIVELLMYQHCNTPWHAAKLYIPNLVGGHHQLFSSFQLTVNVSTASVFTSQNLLLN